MKEGRGKVTQQRENVSLCYAAFVIFFNSCRLTGRMQITISKADAIHTPNFPDGVFCKAWRRGEIKMG